MLLFIYLPTCLPSVPIQVTCVSSTLGVHKGEKEEQPKEKQLVKKKNSAGADLLSAKGSKSSQGGPQDLGDKRSFEGKKTRHVPVLSEVSEENV